MYPDSQNTTKIKIKVQKNIRINQSGLAYDSHNWTLNPSYSRIRLTFILMEQAADSFQVSSTNSCLSHYWVRPNLRLSHPKKKKLEQAIVYPVKVV